MDSSRTWQRSWAHGNEGVGGKEGVGSRLADSRRANARCSSAAAYYKQGRHSHDKLQCAPLLAACLCERHRAPMAIWRTGGEQPRGVDRTHRASGGLVASLVDLSQN